MSLPSFLAKALTDHLGEPPEHVRSVGGGDISNAARFQAGRQAYLVKWHVPSSQPMPGWPDMFAAEALGLQLLASAEAVRVPRVVAHGQLEGEGPGYIVLEWIERDGGDRGAVGAELGRRLSNLHRVTAQAYGLDHGNYCGATPQDNRWAASWTKFYGDRRLGFQLTSAEKHGLMPRQRRQRMERLIGQLGRWIDETACQPSLLHGDLWGGNWLVATGGEPVLIDPAVYYGDREAELAMCRLFGGFPPEFYRAYDEAWPPAPGRDERVPLYQLYHVLNHLNLFGEGYGGHVDAILRRYVG